MDIIDKDEAQDNPGNVFERPADLVRNKELSADEKTRALQEWELEARLLEVAVEEGMASTGGAGKDEPSALREIKKAQLDLGAEPVKDDGTPTKL